MCGVFGGGARGYLLALSVGVDFFNSIHLSIAYTWRQVLGDVQWVQGGTGREECAE